MKRIFFFVALAAVSILLSSCLTGEEHSTPIIRASYLYRDTPAGVHDSVNYGDTVQLGDTLRAPLLLMGGYNNLTEFQVTFDTAEMDLRLLIDSGYDTSLHLDPASKPENGYLRFAKDIYIYPTWLYYVPKKTGDLKITMTISSTAGDKYSPLSAWFITPVR